MGPFANASRIVEGAIMYTVISLAAQILRVRVPGNEPHMLIPVRGDDTDVRSNLRVAVGRV